MLAVNLIASSGAALVSGLTFDIIADNDANFSVIKNDVPVADHITTCQLEDSTGTAVSSVVPPVSSQVVFSGLSLRIPRGSTVYFVARYQFDQCVARYRGDHWVKNFSCWEQFLALAFGQLLCRESLRDIVVCLGAHREKLYHLGFRSVVARNTLSPANEKLSSKKQLSGTPVSHKIF